MTSTRMGPADLVSAAISVAPSVRDAVASLVPCDMLRLLKERTFISAADMDRMTPNERAEAVIAATCRSWDEVPGPFRSKILAEIDEMAKRLPQRD